jgi:hypothetical protein
MGIRVVDPSPNKRMRDADTWRVTIHLIVTITKTNLEKGVARFEFEYFATLNEAVKR